MIMNENNIRKELTAILAEEPDNIDEILRLSHQLAYIG